MNDLLVVLHDVIRLLKAEQLEAAANRLKQAKRIQEERSYIERQKAVAIINHEIREIKRQRDRIRQIGSSLPETQRFFAERQIDRIVEFLCASELAELRARKRALSRPR